MITTRVVTAGELTIITTRVVSVMIEINRLVIKRLIIIRVATNIEITARAITSGEVNNVEMISVEVTGETISLPGTPCLRITLDPV